MVVRHILTGAIVLFSILAAQPASAQCIQSPPECPAPNSADPLSKARLNLFPGSGSLVVDNAPLDLNPACNAIRVTDLPIPDPFNTGHKATFTGELVFQPPTSTQAGSLTLTNAVIDNPADGLPLFLGNLPTACGEYYVDWSPNMGFITVEIDGKLDTPAPQTVGTEEFHLKAIGDNCTVPGPPAPIFPGSVLAKWFASGLPVTPPDNIFKTETVQCRFLPGPGILDLEMTAVLFPNERIVLPNSAKVTLGPEGPAEPPRSRWDLLLLGLGLLVAIAVFLLLVRRRRGSEGRSAGS